MLNSGVRLALLGCGRVAQHYKKIITGLHPVQDLEVVAVCDIDYGRAAEIAQGFGAEAFSDKDAMVESTNPHIVAVLTPSGYHYEHSKWALNIGKHVLCEKPICMIPDQAYELTALAKERGLMYGVAFQNRFNPSIEILADAVKRHRFGKIISATIRLRWCRYQDYYGDDWHGTWAQDGGVINQQAIHHVDILNWMCGPVEAVCAESANRMNTLEAEDTMVAVIRFVDGALGTIEATTAARPQDFEATLSIVGEKGLVQIGGIALNRVDIWSFIDSEPNDETIPEQYSQNVPTGYGVGHGPLLTDLVARLKRGETAAPIAGSEGVKSAELVHALYRSIETKGWVELASSPRSDRLGRG